MKTNRGFTLVETLVVIAILAVLAMIILPQIARRNTRYARANCSNNLKQIGLSFRTWSTDNNDLYPMSYFTNGPGEMLFANASNLFRVFQEMSNEINNPKILVCPEDVARPWSTDFGSNFSGANVSYFIGLDASEKFSSALLSGDRNITNGLPLQNGILNVTTNRQMGWTSAFHKNWGNILLSDLSVQQVTSKGLRQLVADSGFATNRLGMP